MTEEQSQAVEKVRAYVKSGVQIPKNLTTSYTDQAAYTKRVHEEHMLSALTPMNLSLVLSLLEGKP